MMGAVAGVWAGDTGEEEGATEAEVRAQGATLTSGIMASSSRL